MKNGPRHGWVWKCSRCGRTYNVCTDNCNGQYDCDLVEKNCPVQGSLKCTLPTSWFELSCEKVQGEFVDSYALSCDKILNAYYCGAERIFETCGVVVTSIEPVISTQNVARARIDFNIKATYLDGHTRIIAPSSTNYDSTKDYNGEEVILYYTGIVNKAGENGTLSTTMTLTTK